MVINSNYIVGKDVHHGATFYNICYLFTCHIIPDIGRRHDIIMIMFGSGSSILTCLQASLKVTQNRPMAIIFVKNDNDYNDRMCVIYVEKGNDSNV